MRRFFSLLLCVALCVSLAACLSSCGKSAGDENATDASTVTEANKTETTVATVEQSTTIAAPATDVNPSSTHTQVRFTMENGGSFVVELYPEYAPETVANFISLVNSGFYNGLTFHRIVDEFMAQGGSKDGIGIEGSGTAISGEFAANGFSQNTLSHTRGVISMARTNDPNSASSQFFICYNGKYTSALDGRYAAFGKVIEGMEVVDAFTELERTYNSNGELAVPVEPLVMKKVEVIK